MFSGVNGRLDVFFEFVLFEKKDDWSSDERVLFILMSLIDWFLNNNYVIDGLIIYVNDIGFNLLDIMV